MKIKLLVKFRDQNNILFYKNLTIFLTKTNCHFYQLLFGPTINNIFFYLLLTIYHENSCDNYNLNICFQIFIFIFVKGEKNLPTTSFLETCNQILSIEQPPNLTPQRESQVYSSMLKTSRIFFGQSGKIMLNVIDDDSLAQETCGHFDSFLLDPHKIKLILNEKILRVHTKVNPALMNELPKCLFFLVLSIRKNANFSLSQQLEQRECESYMCPL